MKKVAILFKVDAKHVSDLKVTANICLVYQDSLNPHWTPFEMNLNDKSFKGN